MSELFKVGEIVVGQNMILVPHLNGVDLEVIGDLELRVFLDAITGKVNPAEFRYLIRCPDGIEWAALPHQLRRKQPPQSYTGELRIIELFNVQPVKVGEPA